MWRDCLTFMRKGSSKWKTWNASDLIRHRVLDIGDGYRAKNSEMGSIGLPFARAGNINGGFLFDDADILHQRSVSRAGEKVAKSGDVVFTSKGTVGRFAFVKDNTPRFVYSPQLCFWRVLDRSVINERFLYYWMQSPAFLNQVRQVKGLTDMADYVSLADQRRMTISAPDIDAQEAIAKVIGAYDDLIENNTRRIKLVQNIAEAIFKGARTHSGKLWNLVPISSLYVGLYDGPHATPKPSESGPIFLGIQNVTERGELDLSSIRHIAREDFATWTRRVQPAPGDIVFTYEATLHRYGMIREGFEGCLGRRLALIRPDLERVDPHFLLYSMLDEEWRREVVSKIIAGATVDRVPLTTFPRFQLRVPTLAVQREIGASIRACEELADNCSRRNRVLRATRDFLLPKLISGEVSVEHLETEAARTIS
jgi:type I restriction enzyme S subunit